MPGVITRALAEGGAGNRWRVGRDRHRRLSPVSEKSHAPPTIGKATGKQDALAWGEESERNDRMCYAAQDVGVGTGTLIGNGLEARAGAGSGKLTGFNLLSEPAIREKSIDMDPAVNNNICPANLLLPRPNLPTWASTPTRMITALTRIPLPRCFLSMSAAVCGFAAPLLGQATKNTAFDGTSAEMWGADTDRIKTGTRGEWLRDSRFAMFIHWGLYSHLGGQWNGQTHYGISEWIMKRAEIPSRDYAELATRFNPTSFDAREWVRLAKAAGMRHIIITSKHHEGFAMFKSEASPFNIVDATPFKRDPLKELAEACAAEGLKLGFYYSQTQDWFERDAYGNTWENWPTERNFERYLQAKVMPQLEELLTNYGPIAAIWFDTPGPIKPEESRMLVDFVHRLQPDCLVNSRIGNGMGDYETLGDQEIPRFPRTGLWESIDTHNDSWAYASYDHNWKSAREIAERLVRVVSRGGTYMFNVGPDGAGRIPFASVEMLQEVGRWVTAHERAIHGASPSPLPLLAWGECTARDKSLFLHVFSWPDDGRLVVPGLRKGISQVRLVADNSIIPFDYIEEGAVLRAPRVRPDGLIPVLVVELQSEPEPDQNQYVLDGIMNRLDALSAQVVGGEIKKVRWMEKFGDWKHADCVLGWQPEGASATWPFRTLGAGRFYVDIEYTADERGDYSEWELKLADDVRTFPLIDTGERKRRAVWAGNFPRFRTYRAGILEIKSAGDHNLVLRSLDEGGTHVRVAGLLLTPVK